MIEIAIVVLIVFLLIGWCIVLAECQHEHATGIANYYDAEHGRWVHLKTCDDCGSDFMFYQEV